MHITYTETLNNYIGVEDKGKEKGNAINIIQVKKNGQVVLWRREDQYLWLIGNPL